MDKFNSVFTMKNSSEMKNFYKNPTVLIGFLALVLVLVSYFAPIPFYWQLKGYGGLNFQTLLTTNADMTLIIMFEVLTIVFVSISLIFSLLFKNSKGLSAISIFTSTLVLVFSIIQYIYLTEVGVMMDAGRYAFEINFSYGSLAVILASILLIGLEFYKLGWQGYEVAEENPAEVSDKYAVEQNEEIKEPEIVEEKVAVKAEAPVDAKKKATTKKTTTTGAKKTTKASTAKKTATKTTAKKATTKASTTKTTTKKTATKKSTTK